MKSVINKKVEDAEFEFLNKLMQGSAVCWINSISRGKVSLFYYKNQILDIVVQR